MKAGGKKIISFLVICKQIHILANINLELGPTSHLFKNILFYTFPSPLVPGLLNVPFAAPIVAIWKGCPNIVIVAIKEKVCHIGPA